MIAALYVAPDGPYIGIPGVDPWTADRDARLYSGPWPVIAHPPCERWGRYAKGGPNPRARRRELGDDRGCMAAAVLAVRTFGGVLEQPSGSHAFRVFGLPRPAVLAGWTDPDEHGGRSCVVDQGAYGHPAKKPTWLYARRKTYPDLRWQPVSGRQRLELGPRSAEQARAIRSAEGYRPLPRLSAHQRLHTPIEFRDALIALVTGEPQPIAQDVLGSNMSHAGPG